MKERRARGRKSGANECTKLHAYKWHANKIHLSTVVCTPLLASAYKRAMVLVKGHTTPASCDARLPGSFPPSKQIYRSIIDFAYDWNHLHDVGIYTVDSLSCKTHPSFPSRPSSLFLYTSLALFSHHESSVPTALLWLHAINV